MLFSKVAAPICIPTNSTQVFPSLHFLADFFISSLFDNSYSYSVKWYLIVILLYISLIISVAKHVGMCLLVICMSSLEKYLFIFLPTS